MEDETLGFDVVLVGRPRPIGDGAHQIWSAIGKQPVGGPSVELGPTGIAGDRQADLVSHGGPEKAVYVYPAGNYAFWRSLSYDLEPGGVGENVTTSGPDEGQVRIGDVWAWGAARVQVAQPRTPCFKLALHSGRPEIAADMIDSGRCGWYLRVLRPGSVPTTGSLRLISRDHAAPTVRELFTGSFARSGRLDPAALRRMVDTPALAAQWRAGVLGRLQRLEALR